jgi:D-alanyl-D-alanine carboxypeptidase/D-alanyl-D-alanine-endopeptidase (penicillin-binding protein 4)
VNPASIMKLVTTYAALDLLGPAFVWTTPVYVEGTVSNGVLSGNLYLKGQGDPKLVIERMWLLLRRVQGLGITTISGDIVIDRSAFETIEADPSAFDGEGLRPYNAAPDALLVNYKSVVMTFVPGRDGQAQVHYEPPMAGVATQAAVPLGNGECGDWRGALRGELADPLKIRFAGSYPASCGEKSWATAYAAPRDFALRAVGGIWAEMGGKVGGQMREGRVPAGLKPAFEVTSPPLAEVIRDINKYSNNVMAQQLFLTLGLTQRGLGSPELAREVLRQWLAERWPEAAPSVAIDNGSGLSRDSRITAQLLARVLQADWMGPVMPELMSSLPVSGLDGTLKRSRATLGRAHLKTGSLKDVAGIAGFVLGNSGRRYLVVAIINHPNANAARPALDAMTQWVINDTVN